MIPRTRKPAVSEGRVISVRLNAAEGALLDRLLEGGGAASDVIRIALLTYARRRHYDAYEGVGHDHGKSAEWCELTAEPLDLD